MKIVKQLDGLYTITAEENKVLTHSKTHINTHLAADLTEAQVKNWQEILK